MPEAILAGEGRRGPREAMLALGAGAFGAVVMILGMALTSPVIGAVIFLSAAGGLAIIAFAPGLSLLAVAFVVPLERLGRFGDDLSLETFSLMRLVGLLSLVAVFAHMIMRRQKLEWSLPLTLYGILQLMAFGSIFYAVDPEATRAEALTMLGAFLMMLTISQGVRDWRLVDGMILAWLGATLLIGVYQVYDWHFGVVLSDSEIGEVSTRFSTTINAMSESDTLGAVRRAVGTTSNFAVYGINLLLATPFLFYRMRLARNWGWRLFWALGVVLVFYNIMLTNTRATLLFAFLLYGMIVAVGLFRLTPMRILLALLGLVAMVPFLPQSIWDRILNPHAYELDKATNLSWRFDLWEAALKLGTDNWLSGIGVGNRTAIIAGLDPTRFDGDWIMAHNEFLQLYTELGLPGLLVFLAFLGAIIGKTYRLLRRSEADPALARQRGFAAAALPALIIAPLFGLQVDVFHFPLKGWWLVASLVLVVDRLFTDGAAVAPGRSLA